MKARDLSLAIRGRGLPEKAKAVARFFKSGPGQYAEGDKFLGVTVPEIRAVARQFRNLPLGETEKLVLSPWHEERLCGLLLLVDQFARGDEATRQIIYGFYLAHTRYVNSWDLVDLSAEFIVGPWLEHRAAKMKTLKRLAASELLWDRRIAMVATFHYIKQGSSEEALAISEQLLYDKHDLIQKAVGWMLREVGKRVSPDRLRTFLDAHAATMPRTTLRYAIEHFTPPERWHYLRLFKISK